MKHQISRRDFLKASGASALAMSAMGLVGCGSGDSSSTSSGGSSASGSSAASAVYSILYSSQPGTLNYLVTSSEHEYQVGANCVDTLVEFDNKGVIKEGLATEWTWDVDTLTWTFNLRAENWVDHNGEVVAAVTAQDFADAMKYQLTPSNASANVTSITGYIANAEAYYNYNVYYAAAEAGQVDDDGTTYAVDASGVVTVTSGSDVTTYEPVDFADVGVTVVDDYTLQYTLSYSFPGFISMLVFSPYQPVYGAFLEEMGASFGTSAETMLNCGAYYLSEYVSLETWVMTKNPENYDADNVHVEVISRTYNAEANTIGPEMIKRGEIDEAGISSDILDAWLADAATADYVSMERPSTRYSYFYLFNFAPFAFSNSAYEVIGIDAEYEPENWAKAINNFNFRKSFQCAINHDLDISIVAPEGYEDYQLRTVSPENFCSNEDGVDFTQIADLGDVQVMYDEDEAVKYRDLARAELEAAGATFPIKVLMPYNPSVTDWDKMCLVVKQQLERVLGDDFVTCILQEGPSDSFLSDVRRVGKYCFLLCNWDAGYCDPQTETEQFYQAEGQRGYRYCFLRTAVETGTVDGETSEAIMKYMTDVEAAMEITEDINTRYEAFANAEAHLINNAFVIPRSLSIPDYLATRLNYWGGQYSSTGFSDVRIKGMTLSDTYITMEQYAANRDAR